MDNETTKVKFNPINVTRTRMLIFALLIAIVGVVGLTMSRAASQHKVRFVMFCAEGCDSTVTETQLNSYATEVQNWYKDKVGKTFELLPTKTFHASKVRSYYSKDNGFTKVAGYNYTCNADATTNTFCNLGNEPGLLENDVKVVVMLNFKSMANCGVGSGPLAISDPVYGCKAAQGAVLAHEFGHALGLAHTTDGTLMHTPYACNGTAFGSCGINANQKQQLQSNEWLNRTYNPAPSGVIDTTDNDSEEYACSYQAGWADDSSDPNAQIPVHVYVNGSQTGVPDGTFLEGISANQRRVGDVKDYHGWIWNIPSSLKDGNYHNVEFFPIDNPTNGGYNLGNGTITSLGVRTIRCDSGPFKVSALPKCIGNKSKVELSWTGGNNSAGWNIDLDNDTNAGWWYRDVGDGNVRSFVLPDDQLNQHDNPTPPEKVTLTGGRTYRTRIFSDAGGNATEWLSFVATSNCDTVAPAAPQGLRVNGTPTNSSVSLAWNANASSDEVTTYELTISGGTSRVTEVGNVTSYTVTGLAASTTYTFSLKAKDNASPKNTSSASASLSTTTSAAPVYQTIVGVPSNRCADVQGSSTTAGRTIQLYDCHGGDNQKWALQSDGTLRNPGNTCLGIEGNVLANGKSTQTQACTGVSTQKWSLRTLTGNKFEVVTSSGNKCLDARGPSTENATVLQIWDCLGSAQTNQHWSNSLRDDKAPSTPTNLKADSVNSTDVTLSWTASTDNVAIDHYELWRNGSFLKNVSNISTVDSGLAQATNYRYKLNAVDAAGNKSAYTAEITVTTKDGIAPSKPNNLRSTSTTQTSINLSWDASTDNIGVKAYHIYRRPASSGSFAKIGEVNHPTTSFSNTGLTAGTSYDFFVGAIDAAGNRTDSNTLTQSTAPIPDNTPPGAPLSLRKNGTIQHNSVPLTWDAPDGEAAASYRIFRDNVEIASNITTTSYTDRGVAANKTYSYFVKAVDAANNVSSNSNTLAITTPPPPDTVAPAKPAKPVIGTITPNSIAFSWTANATTDGVAGYALHRNGSFFKDVPASQTSFTDTGLAEASTYAYSLKAYDAAGNYSVISDSSSATTTRSPDTQAPSVPTNVRSNGGTANSVNLVWNASTDNVGVRNYLVYSGTTVVANVTTNSVTLSGLTGGTKYSYSVRARDVAGNYSSRSTPAFVYTNTYAADTQRPTTPTNFRVVSVDYYCVNFKFGLATDNGAVEGYRLYKRKTGTTDTFTHAASYPGNSYWTPGQEASVSMCGLPAGINYEYYLVANQASGDTSAYESLPTPIVNATILEDNSAPTQPGNLRATAIRSDAVEIRWDASSDVGLGVYRYFIYRNGNYVGYRDAKSGITTFTDTNLATNTTYTYYIDVTDGRQYGPRSNNLSVKTCLVINSPCLQ